MAHFEDDKAQYVIPFIIDQVELFNKSHTNTPFFIGLNGVQGAGKSVLVDIIQNLLRSDPYNLPTVVFSLDDLYLTHVDQKSLAQANPDNSLLQHRGQPSTHDIELAEQTFNDLKANKPTKIPSYNKAAFSGQGDRVPDSEWQTVNSDSANPVRVVLFEGWCVGFRALSSEELLQKYNDAINLRETSGSIYRGRLAYNTLKSVTTINDALARYDAITDQLDAFIHIDAQDPQFVYKWRLEQEQGLRKKKGSGMTDEQVKNFVDGYYPAYELYTDGLRAGVFMHAVKETRSGFQRKQLRLVVGQDRKVVEVMAI